MKDAFAKVAAFHRAYGVDAPSKATLADEETQALRVSLIAEEFGEYQSAVASGDLVQVADAIADLAYVVVGTAVAHGLIEGGGRLRQYRCKCGKTAQTEKVPYRCQSCPECGSNLTIEAHGAKAPEKHDFALINDVRQCRRCGAYEGNA